MQINTQLRSDALEFREMAHNCFGRPGEVFSVLSLSLDSRCIYERALIWNDAVELANACVDARNCGELCYWTNESIPTLLSSQSPLAEAWIEGWSKGEQINFDSVYDVVRPHYCF